MGAKTLDCLRESADLADLFWELCEFAVLDEAVPDWFAMESGETVRVVGKDACGGRFCLCPRSSDDSGRLLYIDSEGQAGVIASSLREGIQIMIALPYWRDCLQFSEGGNIEEMLEAQAYSEARIQQQKPDIAAIRSRFSKAFGVLPLATPVETLHQAVKGGADLKVIATCDGSSYGGLFSKFVVRNLRDYKTQQWSW